MRSTKPDAATISRLAAELKRGWTLHQAGKTAAAEPIYRTVLASVPDDPDTLLLLGRLLVQTNRAREALPLLERARGVNPKAVAVHFHLGLALQGTGRMAEALACFESALVLQPNDPGALKHRGIVLAMLGRPTEALASLDAAIALQPNDADCHVNRAGVLLTLKRGDEALAAADRALTIRPNHVGALANRGSALLARQQPAEALTSLDRALALQPAHPTAGINRCRALLALGRNRDILETIGPLLQRENVAPNIMLLGVAALRNDGQLAEALALVDRLLARSPPGPDALVDKGVVLEEMGRHEEALVHYERALATAPDHALAGLNAALSRLRLGDLRRGWAAYERRWRRVEDTGSTHDPNAVLWLGDAAIAGKTIVLHAEQGFGDTLQFCRYAPIVAAMGAQVVLEVQPGLETLLNTMAGQLTVIARGQGLPPHDFHSPMMSLPLACGTTQDTIPANTPYLHVPPGRTDFWDARLGPRTTPRIGVAWWGLQHIAKRSIPLPTLAPLLRQTGVTFHGLQKDIPPPQREWLAAHPLLRLHDEMLADFADTAALIAALDLVITIDTSVAHLAGALGKTMWVLLPHFADWRWGMGDTTPWYPSARLFRQSRHGDWGPVIDAVSEALNGHIWADTADAG